MQSRLIPTKIYYKVFLLSEKKQPTNLQIKQLQKSLSPVCMLLVQLASMNISYSMKYLVNIIFHKSLSLLTYFLTAMLLLSLNKNLKEVGILHISHISTTAVQQQYQNKSAV